MPSTVTDPVWEAASDRRDCRNHRQSRSRFAPFNAPFYRSLGFHIVEGDACPERLNAILSAEKAKGLDPLRRVAMMLAF